MFLLLHPKKSSSNIYFLNAGLSIIKCSKLIVKWHHNLRYNLRMMGITGMHDCGGWIWEFADVWFGKNQSLACWYIIAVYRRKYYRRKVSSSGFLTGMYELIDFHFLTTLPFMIVSLLKVWWWNRIRDFFFWLSTLWLPNSLANLWLWYYPNWF